jgi:hypothetical protein
MSPRLHIGPEHFAELTDHLSRPERVVFMLADYSEECFEVGDLRVIRAPEIQSQSLVHVALADAVRPEILRWAADAGASLLEAHSHGPDFAQFSASDLHGFAEWVPHVMWRLSNAPYAALVVSGEEWDGLAWIADPRSPAQITTIEVTSEPPRSIAPTGQTLASAGRGPGSHG